MKDGKQLVWILDNEWTHHELEKEIYAAHSIDCKVTTSETLEQDLKEYGIYADGVIAQVGFPCDRTLIEQMKNCKAISVTGVGVNHVDVEAAKEHGIVVTNVPDYCIDEVSEHTLALSLAMIRRLRAYNEQVRKGHWDPLDTKPIKRISGQTVGLFGFGRIARKVAEKFKPFGVKLIAHDAFVGEEIFDEYGVEPVSLDDLLARADILSLHVPLTKETFNLLTYENLKKLPKGAIIVNTCRGGVINEDDLKTVLEEGHLSGAALDVLYEEPPSSDHPLLHHEDVLITPHASYVSVESERELRERATYNLIEAMSGKKNANTVVV